MRFTINDIAVNVKGKLISGDPQTTVNGFSIDSRSVKPGEIFIAVKGENFDGNEFAFAALEKGAVGVISAELEHLKELSNTNLISVDSAIKALRDISSMIRNSSSIPFICVTGTNGKTTVKDFLRHILSAKYKVLYSKKSYNNIFGVALTLFELRREHELAVFEIGTNSPGEISELAGILKPDVGVITNIGYGHIGAFNSLEGVLREKTSMFDHINDKGLAVLNKDDDLLSTFRNGNCRNKYFGRNNGSDFFISGVIKNDNGYKFLLNGQEYLLPVDGQHNIDNAAAAICVADHLGIEYPEIKNALEKVCLPDMRLSRIMADNVLFINDAYNANPSSFICALNSVKYEITAPKKGVIAGDMLELGNRSFELHSNIGKKIAELDMDFFIGLGENASIMVDAAISAGMPVDRTKKVSSHKEAAIVLKDFADIESAVLLKGSRKSRMEEVVKCFMNYITN